MMLLLCLLAVPVLSAAWLIGTRTAVQRAADAAALAGAGLAVVAQQVDARGDVYCATAAVDPVQGPAVAAQYWARNVTGIPTLQTLAFVARPQGATLTVQGTVSAAAPLRSPSSRTVWTVTAVAELRQPAGVAACP